MSEIFRSKYLRPLVRDHFNESSIVVNAVLNPEVLIYFKHLLRRGEVGGRAGGEGWAYLMKGTASRLSVYHFDQ